MDDGLGLRSWSKAVTNVTWNSNHPEPIEFYHRCPIEVAKWLLMQPYFEDYQDYNPIQRYVNEERHYSSMFEAKYMWDIQVSIQVWKQAQTINSALSTLSNLGLPSCRSSSFLIAPT